MRVQEGCFLFFPWTFSGTDSEFLTFDKFVHEQRRYIEEHNARSDEKKPPVVLAEKRVKSDSKLRILRELDENYGISEQSILIDSKFTEETIEYYTQLKNYAEDMSRELVKRERHPLSESDNRS
jgi:hypothetical protein